MAWWRLQANDCMRGMNALFCRLSQEDEFPCDTQEEKIVDIDIFLSHIS
jgi:hypothetical protein